jgi:hypothetical protein
MLFDDDQVEALCVAAASLARRLLADGSSCGLVLGAQLAGGRRWAYVPAGRASGQLGRIEDVLARVQPILSLPFERLLPVIPHRMVSGGTVVSMSARDPEPYLPILRRISRGGYEVTHLAMGSDAAAHRDRAAAAGLTARVGELNPNWREADALIVAA